MFNIFNNQYGMGGQTNGETMAYDILARLGAGFAPNQMNAERVDGFNPLAVIEAVGRKKQLLLEGKGPVLLDVLTYRYAGHSPWMRRPTARRKFAVGKRAIDHVYRGQLIEAALPRARGLRKI
jgi:2-oxoisovalerate dehydrogenase E1 component